MCICLKVFEIYMMEKSNISQLEELISQVENPDIDYKIRYGLVFESLHMSNKLGLKSGIGSDDPNINCVPVIIELPDRTVVWRVQYMPTINDPKQEKYIIE